MMSILDQLVVARHTPLKKQVPVNRGVLEEGKSPELLLSTMDDEVTTSVRLQRETGLDRGTVNSALKRLVKKGLVEVVGDRAIPNNGSREILYRKVKEE